MDRAIGYEPLDLSSILSGCTKIYVDYSIMAVQTIVARLT